MKRWLFLHCTFFLPLCMHACSLSHFSHIQLFVTPQTVVHQAPLSIEFSRQEFWSGLSCPPPGACQVSVSFSISQSLLKFMYIELMMPSNQLILCHPFLPVPSVFPSIRVFSNAWHQVAKVLELQLQHQSFQRIFTVDFL